MKNFKEFLLEDMSVGEAIKVFNLDSMPTKEDITKLYRKLSMKNHPDRGGSTEKMAMINQAKQVLLKNVGKVGSISKTFKNDDEREKQRKTVQEVVNSYLSKFNPNIYENYLRDIFKKSFSSNVKIEKITEKDRRGMVRMEFADEKRDIVFDLRIFTGFVTIWEVVNSWFGEGKKNFGGSNIPIQFVLQSDIYVNGRKQPLQKSIQKDSSDAGIFDDPSILLPRKKIEKFLVSARPVKKRDFESMIKQKFGGKDEGNGFYSIKFDDFVVIFDRIVMMRMGMYRINSIKKITTDPWLKWSNDDYIKVPVNTIVMENQDGFEFMKDALEQLKKDKDAEKFVNSFVEYNKKSSTV